ncbi:MAG: hypothetical protein Q9165_006722 [Trypethelium subeluteriae]
MSEQDLPDTHLHQLPDPAGTSATSAGHSRRSSGRYQPDISSGLAGEEFDAEERGREAAAGDAPRATRGLKLNLHEGRVKTAPQGPKRVKYISVGRAFILGSQAWALDESNKPEGTPADHTKGWKVYVKGIENGPDITTWLKKVQFKLHHTYANNTRTVESPPFEIHETGWGGFQVEIRLFFASEANEKPQWRTHLLQLEPYGSDAEIEAQKAKNLVVSEICEMVDFNEPVEPFYAKLTSEAQWAYMDKGKAKGKNRQGQAWVPKEERTAQLPERSTPTNQFSKETEAAMLDMLRKATDKVFVMIEEEKKAATERAKEIKSLQESGDWPQPARKR